MAVDQVARGLASRAIDASDIAIAAGARFDLGWPAKEITTDYVVTADDLRHTLVCKPGGTIVTVTYPATLPDGHFSHIVLRDAGSVFLSTQDADLVAFGGAYNTLSGLNAEAEVKLIERPTVSTAIFHISGNLSATQLDPPVTDDFTGDGNLHNRALSDGSLWTVDWSNTSGSVTTSLTTASGAVGKNGAGAGNTYGHATAANPYSTFRFRALTVAMANIWAQIGYSGTASNTRVDGLRFTSSISGDTGSLSFAAFKGGSAAAALSPAQAVGHRLRAGDIFEVEFAADETFVVKVNGREVSPAISYAGRGIASSGKFGFNGLLAVGGADDYMSCDKEDQAYLSLYFPSHVIQKNTNGSLTIHVTGEYNFYSPAQLKYSIYDIATGAALTNHNNLVLPNLSAGIGTFTGSIAVSAADMTGITNFKLEVRREGLTGGAIARAPTCYWRPGEVTVVDGQSNATRVLTLATVTVETQPTIDTAFRTDASAGIAIYTRRELQVSANTVIAVMHNRWNTIAVNPTQTVVGGLSGSTIATRAVGSIYHQAVRDAIMQAGGNAQNFINVDGENDALGGTDIATYSALITAKYADYADLVGHSIDVAMSPIGACFSTSGGTDAEVEAMRKGQWALGQSSPTFVVGGYKMDLQHFTSGTTIDSNLHYDGDATGEYMRRALYALLFNRGLLANDRNGPLILSAERVDAQTIRVFYELNGATALSLTNFSFAADYRGGMAFSSTTTFTATVMPIGATLGAVVGTTQTIDFSFNTGQWPSTCYVRGPYGHNPFNPEDNAAIHLAMATKASMIQGLMTGEPALPVQPYYSLSGPDYLVAA